MTKTSADAATRLMLVDDDPIVLHTLRSGLTERGYAIEPFESAEAALVTYRKSPPDLVLLDLQLKGMSGMDAAREMLKDAFRPIIILSAHYDQSVVHEAVAAGAAAYLVKPIGADQLIPSIEAALARFAEVDALLRDGANLRCGMEKQRLISTATGILMERHGLPNAVAFERLRKAARDDRRPLQDLAFELVEAASTANAVLHKLRS